MEKIRTAFMILHETLSNITMESGTAHPEIFNTAMEGLNHKTVIEIANKLSHENSNYNGFTNEDFEI